MAFTRKIINHIETVQKEIDRGYRTLTCCALQESTCFEQPLSYVDRGYRTLTCFEQPLSYVDRTILRRKYEEYLYKLHVTYHQAGMLKREFRLYCSDEHLIYFRLILLESFKYEG